MKRVGIIITASANSIDGFKSGLRDLGWVEGERVSFELRAARGQLHLLPECTTEMVNLGVQLIVVIGSGYGESGSPSDLDHSDRICSGY